MGEGEQGSAGLKAVEAFAVIHERGVLLRLPPLVLPAHALRTADSAPRILNTRGVRDLNTIKYNKIHVLCAEIRVLLVF